MHEVEVILGLLVAVAALVGISRKLQIPYPVILVLGGLALALAPGIPVIELKPDIVFLVFLPPLLYWESLTSSLRDFKQNASPISLLAIGLVLATTFLVAAVAHRVIPGLAWPAAFVLGSVLAPTDEAAVTEVANRLAIPRRALAILEGESLVNDAISLVAYRMAVVAVVTGAFSLKTASLQFLLVTFGGIGIGLAVGWAIGWLRSKLPDDPPVENTISLLTPFAAYMTAEALGASGVLAVVAIGLYLGQVGPKVIAAQTRIQAGAFWEMITFLLNGLLFILTGMQLRQILHSATPPSPLIFGYAGLLLVLIIVVRAVWVFVTAYFPLLFRSRQRRAPVPSWKNATLVAWVGIRGGLSLLAALAIPLVIGKGQPFPGRDLIICLSFLVILATLLLQGLSLPWLIRRLQMVDDGLKEREENAARLAAARAALVYLDAFVKRQKRKTANPEAGESKPEPVSAALLDDLRDHYARRIEHLAAHAAGALEERHHEKKESYLELRRGLIKAERDTVIRLRDRGDIDDEVLREIQRELDLEDVRLEDDPSG